MTEREQILSLQARLKMMEEALTPSAETKAAYMGEFTIPWPVVGEDGNEYIIRINVPWTTIKELMAAIRARAALRNTPSSSSPTD